jgi:hypothetical protein
MGDLAAFYAARLDEDEAAANANVLITRVSADDPQIDRLLQYLLDPGRWLRQVEAGRAILALHRPGRWNADDDPADIHCAECTADEDLYKAQIWPCPTLRHLAAVYSDHEGYRDEWRP